MLAAGIGRAEIWCNGCHHHAEVAIERFAADTPVPDLCLRFRCSVCGGRNLSSRPSVLDHYAVLRERTGMGYGSTPVKPPAGSLEEQWLIELVEAIEAWGARDDDATAWR